MFNNIIVLFKINKILWMIITRINDTMFNIHILVILKMPLIIDILRYIDNPDLISTLMRVASNINTIIQR